MRYSNLHTHSNFSDGKFSMEEMVLSAIEKNMCSLGFSDHSFTACDPSYCMKLEDYDAYRSTIGALKEKYADQIPLFTGIELDYYSQIQRKNYDYVIASVHYIVHNDVCYPIDHSPKQQQDCVEEVFGGDWEAMAQHYYDMLCEHVARTQPTVVGHFDVITKFSLMPEDSESYRRIAREALEKVVAVCPYVELNTGAISRGWREKPYPNGYLLEHLRKIGGQVLLGSDSHHKDTLTYWFDEGVQLLKEAGFDHICRFNGSGFDEVEI